MRLVSMQVRVFADRRQMGAAAAVDVAETMGAVTAEQSNVRMCFAAAPSS